MKGFSFGHFKALSVMLFLVFAVPVHAQNDFSPKMDMHMRGMENTIE